MAQPVYSVRLDANSAKELFERGATILMLDVPEGTAVGFDHKTYIVGPKFKGVKMIPPGVHAITYAASGKNSSFGPVTTMITNLAGRKIFALRWDRGEEVMERIQDEDELLQLSDAVRTFRFDPELAPYDLASYSAWCQLTNHISPQVLERVLPAGGCISNLSEPDGAASHVMTKAEAALEQQLKQGNDFCSKEKVSTGEMLPNAERCHYTPLPRLIKRHGLTPTELTALNLDKSAALEEIIAGTLNNKQEDLIGEFQLAFLAFLLGHSLEGFSQWKSIMRLMFQCEDAALGIRDGLFADFLEALRAQFQVAIHTPFDQDLQAGILLGEDLFADSFIKDLCVGWLQWILHEVIDASTKLKLSASRLAALLERDFGWDCGAVTELRSSEVEFAEGGWSGADDRPFIVKNESTDE